MPYIETMSEVPDESRDVRMVTARLIEQLEQPQIEGEIRSAVESEFRRFGTRFVARCSPCLQRRCARGAGSSRTEALSLASETRLPRAHRFCRYDQRCS
jgi:hypothetical protein